MSPRRPRPIGVPAEPEPADLPEAEAAAGPVVLAGRLMDLIAAARPAVSALGRGGALPKLGSIGASRPTTIGMQRPAVADEAAAAGASRVQPGAGGDG